MAVRFKGAAFLAAMHDQFPTYAMTVFDGVDNPALAVLWGTFGRNKEPMRHFLNHNTHQKHMLVLYFMNGVCQRKGNCARGEIFPNWSVAKWNHELERNKPAQALVDRISKRVDRIGSFIDKRANLKTVPVLCVCLEDNFTTRAYKTLSRMIKQAGWDYKITRNPVGSAKTTLPRDGLELHGKNPQFPAAKRPTFISLDGVFGMSYAEQQAWLNKNVQKHRASFLWEAENQGLPPGGSAIAPPPWQRTPIVTNLQIDAWNDIFTRA